MPVLGVENILTVYGMSEKVVLYTVISRSFTILCTVLSVVFVGATASVAVCGFVLSSAATCAVGLRLSYLPFRGTVQKDSGLGLKEIFRFSWPVFTSGIYGFVISSASQFFVSRYFGVGDFAVFANGYHELPFCRYDFQCYFFRPASQVFKNVPRGCAECRFHGLVEVGSVQVACHNLAPVCVFLHIRG